jgi:hypothetical protein
MTVNKSNTRSKSRIWSTIHVQIRFGGICRLRLQGRRISKALSQHGSVASRAVFAWLVLGPWSCTCSSESSVAFQRTTRRYIARDRTLHEHRCENLKSCKEIGCIYWNSIQFLLQAYVQPCVIPYHFWIWSDGQKSRGELGNIFAIWMQSLHGCVTEKPCLITNHKFRFARIKRKINKNGASSCQRASVLHVAYYYEDVFYISIILNPWSNV